MTQFVFGRYRPGNSLLHRLAPEVKILGVLTLMGAVFFLNHWYEYVMIVGLITSLHLVGHAGWRAFLQGVLAVGVLMAVSFLLSLFFTPGPPLLTLGPITLSRTGVFAGLTLAGRLGLLSLLAALLGLTSSSMDLALGLTRLLAPLKQVGIPVRPLGLVFALGLRFVPTIFEQGQQIMNAQRARGIDFSQGPLLKRAKRLIAVLLPLLDACLRRADELAMAMEARGYRLEGPRSAWRRKPYVWEDWLALLAVVVVLVAVLW